MRWYHLPEGCKTKGQREEGTGGEMATLEGMLKEYREALESKRVTPAGVPTYLWIAHNIFAQAFEPLMEIAKWAAAQEPYVEEGAYEKASCPGCGASFGVLGEFDWAKEWAKEVAALEHRSNCPIIKARALFGK